MVLSPASAGQARIGGVPMPPALTALLDGSPDPLLLLDSDRRLIFSNVAAGRVLDANGGFAVASGRFSPLGPGYLPAARKGIRRDWLFLVHPMFAGASLEPSNESNQRVPHKSVQGIAHDPIELQTVRQSYPTNTAREPI